MTSDAHMILCPQKNHGFSPNWNTFEQVQKQTNDVCKQFLSHQEALEVLCLVTFTLCMGACKNCVLIQFSYGGCMLNNFSFVFSKLFMVVSNYVIQRRQLQKFGVAITGGTISTT